MELAVKIDGPYCDLALHPISAKSADTIRRLGRKFYTKKYLEWWRHGRTSTCGVKYGETCQVQVCLDGDRVPFDPGVIAESAEFFAKRHYVDTKVRYLAFLGYDDEYCQTTWRWKNVLTFEPEKLEFIVHRWDRVLDVENYLILEDIRYDGQYADEEGCGKRFGFNLVDPKVIDLDEIRQGSGMPPYYVGDITHLSRLS